MRGGGPAAAVGALSPPLAPALCSVRGFLFGEVGGGKRSGGASVQNAALLVAQQKVVHLYSAYL